jgi:3-dehydroquinate synthase
MCSTINIKSKISDYRVLFINNISEIVNVTNDTNTITIIDSTVNEMYPILQNKNNIILNSNEDNKTIEGVYSLIKIISDLNVNINTKLVVIGGGILQDLVGFCASIYCRGISYTLVPTTLLSQTDSCIGGKTSINLLNKKNIIGTFYPPKDILIYSGFLKTLNNVEYISGLGEIYKFHILQNKINIFNDKNEISSMIIDSLKYKTKILELDEFDKKERKFLNYGHTFGHALESVSKNKIPHGIAVIIGCMISTQITKNLGYSVENYDEIIKSGKSLLKKSLITLEPNWFNFSNLMFIVKSYKKSTGKLTMVLVDKNPFLINIDDMDIVKKSLNEIYESI